MRTLGTATLTIVALLSAHGLTAEEKPGLKIDKQAYGKMPDGSPSLTSTRLPPAPASRSS